MGRHLLRVLLIALAAAPLALSAADRPPRLVVIIVIDQMRADFIDRFQDDWSGGLKRLVTRGAHFSRAAFPYLTTVTCAGHATIATGALPNAHGIFQNVWFDRNLGRQLPCTADTDVQAIGYGKEGTGRHSAVWLKLPTFADEMRRQRGSKVVSLSLKARSAIMLAGHGGDAVTWLADSLDRWETSTAFSPHAVPEVEAFTTSHPIEADFGRSWDRLLRPSQYREPDDGLAEAPPPGWTSSFPHPLAEPGATAERPAPAFYTRWERSPFADAYLGAMGAGLTESMGLGDPSRTDVLAISFSSPDLVGHAFGPRSQEVRDMYAHLDRTIGLLLDKLDTIIGRDQYVVALSSDHGVTEIPEQLAEQRREGGRVNGSAMAADINAAAGAVLGAKRFVASISTNDIYFAPGQYQAIAANRRAMQAVTKAITGTAGVARVLRAEDLRDATGSSDAVRRAAALSYVPDRSGDLILVLKPGWMMTARGTTHGSSTPEDQRVPLVFFGQGIRPGSYREAVTPADLAPTLAAIVGITLPSASGRVLTPALAASRDAVPFRSPQ